MTTIKDRPYLAFAIIASISVLFPAEARADAINLGFVAVAGVMILLPLTVFTVSVEGVVLSIGLRVPYRRTLGVLLVANLASLAAGIPTKVSNAWMYSQILPRPLAPYFRQYPLAACLGSTIFFLVTLVAEYLVVAAWRRRSGFCGSRRRLAASVLVANAATYAVLAPLHYMATRPMHDVREFTDGSAWAQRPVTELYFVGGAGNLCSVLTDGQNERVILPDAVRDYQYLPARDAFLYRNGSDDLCLFRRSGGKPILCWKTDQRFTMEQVACSPDGRLVGYLSRIGELQPHELILFDCETGRTRRTGILTDENDYSPEIAWAEEWSKLFLKSGGNIHAISIGNDLSAIADAHAVNNGLLAETYGRFSSDHWWGGSDWGGSFSHDVTDGRAACAVPGLGSHLRVEKHDTTFFVADNPGLLKLGNRRFHDVCLLANGNELVFDDGHDIYLLDVDKRKVGRIVEGSKFMLLTPRFRRDVWTAKQQVDGG